MSAPSPQASVGPSPGWRPLESMRNGHRPTYTRAAMTAPLRALPMRLLAVLLALVGLPSSAQPLGRAIDSVDVQRLANGILGLMSYTVAPDVTTSSMSVENAATANPGLMMTQFGGGFTWSKSTPLYLEGNAAYSRYDPTFVATDGAQQRLIPVKWNAVSATGGIGWDFSIAEHWVLRPMVNFTLGYVTSDLNILKWWVDNNTNLDLQFLDGRKLNARGLGGSLMLDYEKFSPEADDDLELRYTAVELRSYGHTAEGVQGRANANSASIWARRRIPTGWVALERPVRYVFEGAYTRFLGSQQEVGVDRMASLGFGLELDSSAYDIWATRWRAVLRYKFGPDISGWALGLAVSF